MGWMSAICDAHKKVGVELLYNSVKTGSQFVWRPDPLVTRCSRESQHPAEWAIRPPVEQPKRTGKNAVMANRVRVNILQLCSVSNSLSHATFQIEWEVYFSKRTVSSSSLGRCVYTCICIWVSKTILYLKKIAIFALLTFFFTDYIVQILASWAINAWRLTLKFRKQIS